MILLPFLALLSFPFSFAATPDSARQQLVALAAAGGGLIKLDSASYDLLTAPDRDWSASIEFTALDTRRRCAPCKEFNPSWNAVAKAWTKTPKAHRDNHFFATLDFDNGQTVFQQLGLSSAPVVYVFPPVEGPRATGRTDPSKYDFSHGFEPEPLAQHLSNHTPIPIPYSPPFDWARWITIGSGILTFAVTLRFVSPILQSRWTWAVGSILTSLIMTSGYMFTRIRNSPFMGGDGSWIAGGFQNQFGQEVQVVALVYGTLGAAFLMLIMVIPYQTSAQRQRFQIYLWSTIIVLVYSILVVLFKVKNRGYPFRLLL
ncbi:oligosaccharyl transferase subunit OST3/OST6 family [Mycena rosella]|uniref:Oligosaccharyl transferase subunit OST3/OST6 family n=1 Tax=Mycena rosella TaxID=1033263 RepID=A0AAD7H173_MYCRO|nr:oligosaccharyl transferase subunit OST3/OST6 family [Mycena rosella]